MLELDSTTAAEYEAAVGAEARATVVLEALADPVTVTVYNGASQVMGQGTMQSPWANRSSGYVVAAELSSFLVVASGTPDATWSLRFESGSRWIRGSFGLVGSGRDFTWSLPTWVIGQFGTIGAVTFAATGELLTVALAEFADIPEIVFVRGLPEHEELGIYVVDPDARTEPGDSWWRDGTRLQRNVEDGGGDWLPARALKLIGQLPTGVTFDAVTGILEYSGAGAGSLSEWVEVALEYAGRTSRPFRVRVVVPIVVYGDGAAALNVEKGWGAQAVDRNYATANNFDKAVRLIASRKTYSAPGVMLVTPGTYSTADGELFGAYLSAPTSPANALDHFYLLGKPVPRGLTWSPPVLNSATSNFRCAQEFSRQFVIKNLQVHGFTFPVSACYNVNYEATYGRPSTVGVLQKIAQYDTRGTGDAIGSSPLEGDTGDGWIYPDSFRFISNVYQENVGGTGSPLYHMMYVEGRPNLRLRINNHRSNAPDKICSSFQTTAFDIAILNTWVSVLKNADPANALGDDGRSVDLFDLHQCNYSTVYNCRAYTGSWRLSANTALVGCLSGPIFLENRRVLRGGNDNPAYPNLTWQVEAPLVPFTSLWEVVGNLTGSTYTTAVVEVAPHTIGVAAPTSGWTQLAGASAALENANAGNWYVTLDPADFPLGDQRYWLRLKRSDGKFSRLKHLRTYKTATMFAATNYWIYERGRDAVGFDLDALSTFVDDDYWLAVKNTDLAAPDNPHTYKHYWSYNTFEWITGLPWSEPTTLLRDKGMGPVRPLSQGSPETYFMRANPNFQERSCHFFLNNRLVYPDGFLGLKGAELFQLDSTDFAFMGSQYVEPGSLVSVQDLLDADKLLSNYPNVVANPGPGIPHRRVVDVGGNNFTEPSIAPTPVAPPAWFRLATAQPTLLEQAAGFVASGEFSAPLAVPSLNEREPRLDPYNEVGSDFPSSVGGTYDPVSGLGDLAKYTRAWIWTSELPWDPVRRMVLGIVGPHLYQPEPEDPDAPWFGPEGDKRRNQYNSILFTYRAQDNKVQTYEAPLLKAGGGLEGSASISSGFASHGFDNNARRGRVLYKVTTPYWLPPSGPYLDPRVVGINIDAITTDYASVRNGAAVVSDLFRPAGSSAEDITGNALVYHEALDRLYLYHKNRFWFYDFATGSWSNESVLAAIAGQVISGQTYYPYHNLASYNPMTGILVFGGGAAMMGPAFDTLVTNLVWHKIDSSGNVTRLDDAPQALSVYDNNRPEARGIGCHAPGTAKHVFFCDNNNLVTLDPTAAPGSQWTTVANGVPAGALPVDWVCPIPDYGVVMIGSYGGYTNNAMNNRILLYRA